MEAQRGERQRRSPQGEAGTSLPAWMQGLQMLCPEPEVPAPARATRTRFPQGPG